MDENRGQESGWTWSRQTAARGATTTRGAPAAAPAPAALGENSTCAKSRMMTVFLVWSDQIMRVMAQGATNLGHVWWYYHRNNRAPGISRHRAPTFPDLSSVGLRGSPRQICPLPVVCPSAPQPLCPQASVRSPRESHRWCQIICVSHLDRLRLQARQSRHGS